MRVQTSIDTRAATRTFTRLLDEVLQPRSLMILLGRAFRDNVKQRINSRDGGAWAPASKWTRAKKRTNRALSGQARHIKYRLVNPKRAEVYYQGTSETTGKDIKITEHHFGKLLPADGRLVSIPIKNPAPLGLNPGTTRFYFRWNKSSLVPRRKIWPDAPGEASAIARPILSKWAREMVARTVK